LRGIIPKRAGLVKIFTLLAKTRTQELFRKTVGPLKDSFLICNPQGASKGMAIVVFQRPEDAAVARTKYDGKIVDGRTCLFFNIIF
jgi:THO complex subunit 4